MQCKDCEYCWISDGRGWCCRLAEPYARGKELPACREFVRKRSEKEPASPTENNMRKLSVTIVGEPIYVKDDANIDLVNAVSRYLREQHPCLMDYAKAAKELRE